jgi:transcriptional regulator with AAA-type ATPase domain
VSTDPLSGPPPGAETTTREDASASDDANDAALLLVAGEGLVATHALGKPEIVIGRADDCDIVVAHSTLSRRHARLVLGSPTTVQDLGSTNGTRVGERLSKGGDPVALGAGDSFHIGRFSFVLLLGQKDKGADKGTGAAHSLRTDGGQALRVIDPTRGGAAPLLGEIARSDVNVLILGETGVGKEVLAQTLHELSERTGPLVRINCAALSPTLLESELFGHEKGAFTGATAAKQGLLESARGGTVFLDEVGELPAPLQAKLLRAVESKEVLRVGAVKAQSIDVRFVAATNRDLPGEAARGHFRADLYFRLDGVTLAIPPLRARKQLIVPLALGFLEAARPGTPPLAGEVLRRLEEHDWPGNVRELKAVIERALLLARGGAIGPSHLVLRPSLPGTPVVAPPPSPPSPAPDPLAGLSPDEQRERARILEALEACAGNQTRAAQKLGVSRATLVTRLALYRIPRPRK